MSAQGYFADSDRECQNSYIKQNIKDMEVC